MANSRIGAQNMYDEPVISGTRKGKYSKTDEDESLIGVAPTGQIYTSKSTIVKDYNPSHKIQKT